MLLCDTRLCLTFISGNSFLWACVFLCLLSLNGLVVLWVCARNILVHFSYLCCLVTCAAWTQHLVFQPPFYHSKICYWVQGTFCSTNVYCLDLFNLKFNRWMQILPAKLSFTLLICFIWWIDSNRFQQITDWTVYLSRISCPLMTHFCNNSLSSFGFQFLIYLFPFQYLKYVAFDMTITCHKKWP